MTCRSIAVLLLVSCAGGRATETPAPIPSTSSPAGTPASSVSTPAEAEPPPAPDAATTAVAAVDSGAPVDAKPAPVERRGKTWPFHSWDRAEAFTFNRFRMRPGAPFRIYDDNGWSKHIEGKKPLDAALSKQAVDLVLQGKSELEMTKCPFPRHAVVLYDHDVPIASINVCFECGDVLLWPRWGSSDVDWDKLSDAEAKMALANQRLESAKREKVFAVVFPKWKTFFRDGVGFPIDEKWH